MKKTVIFIAVAAVIPAAAIILAFLTLQNLPEIFIGAEPMLSAETSELLSDIFMQIENADFSVHFVLPVFWYAVYCFFGRSLLQKEDHRVINTVWTVLLGILFLLICYLSSLLLTKVNDIRFGSLLFSLIRSVNNGMFEVL